MINIVKKLGIFVFIAGISVNSLAQATSHDDSSNYDTDYYENEGSLTFKVRLSGIQSSASQKGLPAPTSSTPVSVGKFVENGYGGDASTTIFFNNYFAAELSLGINLLRTKYASLTNIANNYNGNVEIGKRKDLYMIPGTVTAQYHIAPYGGIRPYIGAGYHGSYFYNQAKGFKIKNGHGAVAQIGVDFYAKDDTLINLDVRQFFLSPKVTYKPNLVGTNNVTSKVKLNPLVISAGIGFNF
ncbi:OmpW family outer membrane protein [Rickettsia endosymbiont of Halotydeus destructor]|uniref:OmpW family outer membrane protein n=1 Tax=Rickettsia endosymbiont of Halotydeus destructor TaxID=2996754 RepID=UPI003BAFF1FD